MAQTEEILSQTQKPPPVEVWDTRMVAGYEAFDFYREGICAVFMPLRPECSRHHRHSFHATVKSYDLGQSVLNMVNANVHAVLRGSPEIAGSREDCLYLNLPLHGQSRISQNGAAITLHPGDVGLFDSSEPFEIDHGEEGALGVASLMIPKKSLGGLTISAPLVLSDHPVFGDTLTEAIHSLAGTVGTAARRDAAVLQKLILQLVPAATRPPQGAVDPVSQGTALFLRLKRVIRHNCASPEFDLTRCSAIVGLSSGYVQQIFARHDARFSATLLEERLLLAARNLADRSLRHLPISSIAYQSGFNDASHFSRAFKRRFGVSPGVWRGTTADRIH